MLSRAFCLALFAAPVMLWGTPARSQDNLNWAEKMFSELRIDFGNVAKGADVRRNLIITNLYEEDVTLADVSTTCGCTVAKPDRTLLKTHEKAYIEVKMNTVKFNQRKDSNVDVTLTFHGSRGSATRKVRVPVTAYIRTDVVLEPGNVDFGTVEYGNGSERQINIAYAGRNNWTLRDVRTGNDNLIVDFQETARSAGRVNYRLTVRLRPEAEIGFLQDQITLITDDANAPQVPLLVFGRVDADITVTPNPFKLGNLQPGQQKPFTIIFQGKRPFAIENIESDKDWFEVVQSSDAVKAMHVVPFRITAPTTPGSFSETITLSVPGRAQPLTCQVEGTVVSSNDTQNENTAFDQN